MCQVLSFIRQQISEVFNKFTKVALLPNSCVDWLDPVSISAKNQTFLKYLEFFAQISWSCLVPNWQLKLPQMTINWSRVCSSTLTSKTASHKHIRGRCCRASFCISPWPKISDRHSQTTIHCLSICHFLKAEIFYSFIVILVSQSTWWHQLAKTGAVNSNWFQIYKNPHKYFYLF